MQQKTIAVDFDGTIVDHVFPDIGMAVPGALEWLRRYQDAGVRILLWTVRSERHKDWDTGEPITNLLGDAVRYLAVHGVRLAGVNANPGQSEWTSSPKVHADAFVDDMAIGTPLVRLPGFHAPCVDWSKVGPMLEERLFNNSDAGMGSR